MEVREIPAKIIRKDEGEVLELMTRYDFKSLPITTKRLQTIIEDQLKSVPKSTVVVLLYFKEEKTEETEA